MRLFFAVNFSEREKDIVLSKVAQIKKTCISGNFSRRDNLHVTLAFLGEVARERLGDVIEAAKNVDFSPFDMTVRGAGSFGSLVWLGIGGGEELKNLALNVRAECGRLGLDYDKKPFSPHLTVCREAKFCDGYSPSSFGDGALFSKTVASFELMESTRAGGILTYKKLFTQRAK